jgi:hypothetical protein
MSWISLGTATPFDQDVREMPGAAGVRETRNEITTLEEAFMLLQILSQGKHLCVLPRFPTRLLQRHFPLIEIKILRCCVTDNAHEPSTELAVGLLGWRLRKAA